MGGSTAGLETWTVPELGNYWSGDSSILKVQLKVVLSQKARVCVSYKLKNQANLCCCIFVLIKCWRKETTKTYCDCFICELVYVAWSCSRCYSKVEMQQLYCSSISSFFKGLGCKDCCSPTQYGLLRLKTEILNRLRELELLNTEKRRLSGRPHCSRKVH